MPVFKALLMLCRPAAPAAPGKVKVTGPQMTKLVAGVASVLFMMPKLLKLMCNEKSTSADVRVALSEALGPQVNNMVLDAVHSGAFRQLVKDTLGPMAHTPVAAIAQLGIELILSCLSGDMSWDKLATALRSVGMQTLLMCLCVAFPPAAYIPMILSGAWQALGHFFQHFRSS